MQLNSEQERIVIEETIKQLVKEYELRSPEEQEALKHSLSITLIPMLHALPENTQPDELVGYLDLVREVGINILVSQIKEQIPEGAIPDEELRAQVSEEVLRSVVGSLLIVTETALKLLPPGAYQELQSLVEHFDELDLDGELQKLLEE